MIIRSRAPLRISFAGGGTDVEPYLSDRGGAVLSTTIDKYAYSSLRLNGETGITVTSLDYDVVAKYDLRSLNLHELVGYGDQHADFAFAYGAPEGPRAFVSTIKLRQAGFT